MTNFLDFFDFLAIPSRKFTKTGPWLDRLQSYVNFLDRWSPLHNANSWSSWWRFERVLLQSTHYGFQYRQTQLSQIPQVLLDFFNFFRRHIYYKRRKWTIFVKWKPYLDSPSTFFKDLNVGLKKSSGFKAIDFLS